MFIVSASAAPPFHKTLQPGHGGGHLNFMLLLHTHTHTHTQTPQTKNQTKRNFLLLIFARLVFSFLKEFNVTCECESLP